MSKKRLFGGVVALAFILAVMIFQVPHPGGAGDHETSWGQNALKDTQSVVLDTLIRPANACGMGASSCFKCHNGRRAPEPETDPSLAPWHAQHGKVNNSCAGCHNGNPRLMREQMAHQNLLANPREKPSQSCKSCHTSDEVNDFLELYKSAGK